MLRRILSLILIYSFVLLPVQPALSGIAHSSAQTIVVCQTLSPTLVLNEQNMRGLFLDASTWDLAALSESIELENDLIKENIKSRYFNGHQILSISKEIFDSAIKVSKLFFEYAFPKAKKTIRNSIFLITVFAQILMPIFSFAGIGTYMAASNMLVTFDSDSGEVKMMTLSGKTFINYILGKDGKKTPLMLTPGYDEDSILNQFTAPSEAGSAIVNMNDDPRAAADPFTDYYKLTYTNKDIDPAIAAAILNSEETGLRAEPNIMHEVNAINNYFDPNIKPYDLENWGLLALKIPSAWDILNQYDSNVFPPVGAGIMDSGVWDYNSNLQGMVINPEQSYFDPNSDNPHGTIVAGVLKEAAPYSSVKIINAGGLPGGSGTTESILMAIKDLIDLAIENGLDKRLIANCSFGSDGLMENSILDAWKRAAELTNIFIGPAAGNIGTYFDQNNWGHYWEGPLFHPVSSININGQASDFSNYSQWIPYASGEDILGIFPDGHTEYVSGTSFSAPYRNGIVADIIINQAMVHGFYSVPFDHEEIASIIWNTGDIKINTVDRRQMLVVNAEQALKVAYPGVALIENEDRNIVVYNGRPIIGTARVYGGWEHFSSYTLQIKNFAEDEWTTINYSETPVTNGVLGTLDENIAEGWYALRLTVKNTEGQEFVCEGNIGVNRSLVPGWPQEMPGWVYSNILAQLNDSPDKEMFMLMSGKNSIVKDSQGNDVAGWENASETERPYGLTLTADFSKKDGTEGSDGIDELIVNEFPATITVMNATGTVKWSENICKAEYSYCLVQDMIVVDFDADKKPELAITAYVVDNEKNLWNLVQVFELGNNGMKEIYQTKVPEARYGSTVFLFAVEAGNNKKNLGIGISGNDGQSRTDNKYETKLSLVDITLGKEIASRNFIDKVIYKTPVSVDSDGDNKSEIFILGLDAEPLDRNEPTVAEVYGLTSDLKDSLPGFPVRLAGVQTPPIALATEPAAGRTMGDDKGWRIVFGMEGVYDKTNRLVIVPIDDPQSTMQIMTAPSVNNPLIITVDNTVGDNEQNNEDYMQTLVAVSVNRGIALYDLKTGKLERSIPYDDYPTAGVVAFNGQHGSILLSAGAGYHPVYKYTDYPAEMFLMEVKGLDGSKVKGWVQWGEVRGEGQTGLPQILPFDKNDEDREDDIDNSDDGQEDLDASDDNIDKDKDPEVKKPGSRRGGLGRSTDWLGRIEIKPIVSNEVTEPEKIEAEELKTMPEKLKNNKERDSNSKKAAESTVISDKKYPVASKVKPEEQKVEYALNISEKKADKAIEHTQDLSGIFNLLSVLSIAWVAVCIGGIGTVTVLTGLIVARLWERLNRSNKQAVEDTDTDVSSKSPNKTQAKKAIFMGFAQHKQGKNASKQTVSTDPDQHKYTVIPPALQVEKRDILFTSYAMERSI
ncbi:MAG: S8/S53 family peptidase [Candidatus Omnitrophica bacterium]|nr:S8/S53 family peptidase [Candidatus Omnitrophota bacterium]